MRLLFMRHAQAVSQLDGSVVSGRAHDARLTDVGMGQARDAAASAGSLAVDGVYASTCLRAVETAGPIAGALGIPVSETELLIERSHGDLEGQPKEEVYTPALVARIHADQWRWKPPGGESLEETGERLMRFIASLHDAHAEDATVLAVSHQMVGWSLFHLATGCHHGMLPRVALHNVHLAECMIARGVPPTIVRWNVPVSAFGSPLHAAP